VEPAAIEERDRGPDEGGGEPSALSRREMLGYAIGDTGINFYFMASLTFALYFYTDVFGIAPGVAASVLLVARVVDAVTDPMMGRIADHTRTRWGKLRPWLLFGPIPLGLVTIAMFSTPDLSETGKIVWAYATYIGFSIAYTVVTIPYSALTATLTDDHGTRTSLSTVRMLCAMTGGMLIATLLPTLSGMFESPQLGFPLVMAGFGVVGTALIWTSFAVTRERVGVDAPPPSLHQSLTALTHNGPLIAAIVMFTLGMFAFTIRQTVAPYYFKYNLGREDLIGVFFAATMPATLVGLLGVPWLARRFDKAGGMAIGAAVSLLAAVGLYACPYDRLDLIFGFSILGALGGAPIAVLGWAMIPDTVEYAQWKTGARADGTVYSMASFFQKLGKALGGAGAGVALGVAGFVANQEQSAEALWGIVALLTLAPAAILVVVLAATFFYRLDAHTHGRIVEELGARAETAASRR
jgi:sugar (glycoside-pentoside-hexuronide) transporter